MVNQKCWEPKFVQKCEKCEKCECTNVRFSFDNTTPDVAKAGTLYVNDITFDSMNPVGTIVYQDTIDTINEVCLSLDKTYNYTYVKYNSDKKEVYVFESTFITSKCKQEIKLLPKLCDNQQAVNEIISANVNLVKFYKAYLENFLQLQRAIKKC